MIVDKKIFSDKIENIHLNTGLSFIDSTLKACEEYNIDPSMTHNLINEQVKEKIQKEAMDIHLLPKENKQIV